MRQGINIERLSRKDVKRQFAPKFRTFFYFGDFSSVNKVGAHPMRTPTGKKVFPMMMRNIKR